MRIYLYILIQSFALFTVDKGLTKTKLTNIQKELKTIDEDLKNINKKFDQGENILNERFKTLKFKEALEKSKFKNNLQRLKNNNFSIERIMMNSYGHIYIREDVENKIILDLIKKIIQANKNGIAIPDFFEQEIGQYEDFCMFADTFYTSYEELTDSEKQTWCSRNSMTEKTWSPNYIVNAYRKAAKQIFFLKSIQNHENMNPIFQSIEKTNYYKKKIRRLNIKINMLSATKADINKILKNKRKNLLEEYYVSIKDFCGNNFRNDIEYV